MLELGKAGSAGTERGALPVLRNGVVVATLRASKWKEQATAVIGEENWVYTKAGRGLTARRAEDPEGTARHRARRVSVVRSGWDVDLAGTPVEMRTASWWRTAHRYRVGDRVVARSGTGGRPAPRPTLEHDGSLLLSQLVFLLWLELVVRRRAAAAAA